MTARHFTEDELRAAYRSCRRHTWPDDFDAAMNDPFYSRLIRLHATARAKRIEEQATRQSHRPSPVRKALPVPTTNPVFDHKRAAAGEREDD